MTNDDDITCFVLGKGLRAALASMVGQPTNRVNIFSILVDPEAAHMDSEPFAGGLPSSKLATMTAAFRLTGKAVTVSRESPADAAVPGPAGAAAVASDHDATTNDASSGCQASSAKRAAGNEPPSAPRAANRPKKKKTVEADSLSAICCYG